MGPAPSGSLGPSFPRAVPLLGMGVRLGGWDTMGLPQTLTPWGCSQVGGSHGLHCGSLAPVSLGAGAWVGQAPQVLLPMERSRAGLVGT